MKATVEAANQAADLLGVTVYDLGVSLRSHAHGRFIAESNRVQAKGGRPELAVPNALLAASEACERAAGFKRARGDQ